MTRAVAVKGALVGRGEVIQISAEFHSNCFRDNLVCLAKIGVWEQNSARFLKRDIICCFADSLLQRLIFLMLAHR